MHVIISKLLFFLLRMSTENIFLHVHVQSIWQPKKKTEFIFAIKPLLFNITMSYLLMFKLIIFFDLWKLLIWLAVLYIIMKLKKTCIKNKCSYHHGRHWENTEVICHMWISPCRVALLVIRNPGEIIGRQYWGKCQRPYQIRHLKKQKKEVLGP